MSHQTPLSETSGGARWLEITRLEGANKINEINCDPVVDQWIDLPSCVCLLERMAWLAGMYVRVTKPNAKAKATSVETFGWLDEKGWGLGQLTGGVLEYL